MPLYTGGTGENSASGNMYHKEIATLTAKIIEAERPEKIILSVRTPTERLRRPAISICW